MVEYVIGYIRKGSVENYEPKGVTKKEFLHYLNRCIQTGEEFLTLADFQSYDEYASFRLYLEELENMGIPFGRIAFFYETGIETDRCGVTVLTNVERHYVELDDLEEIDKVLYENQKLRRRVDIVSLTLVEDWVVIDKSRFSKKLMAVWEEFEDKSDLIERISIDTDNWTFDYIESKV